MSKKEEGTVKNLSPEIDQKIIAVGTEVPNNAKVDKEDNQLFEDFKKLYEHLIDSKCIADYGTLDDKDLWEDTAKDLFLQTKMYLPKEDDVKPIEELDNTLEKKTESFRIFYDKLNKRDNQISVSEVVNTEEDRDARIQELEKIAVANGGPIPGTLHWQLEVESIKLEGAIDWDYGIDAFSYFDSSNNKSHQPVPKDISICNIGDEIHLNGNTYIKIDDNKWETHSRQNHVISSDKTDKEIQDMVNTTYIHYNDEPEHITKARERLREDVEVKTEDQYENERRKGRPNLEKIAQELFDYDDYYIDIVDNYITEREFIIDNIAEVASEYNLKEQAAWAVMEKIYKKAKDAKNLKTESKLSDEEVAELRNRVGAEVKRYQKFDSEEAFENYIDSLMPMWIEMQERLMGRR